MSKGSLHPPVAALRSGIFVAFEAARVSALRASGGGRNADMRKDGRVVLKVASSVVNRVSGVPSALGVFFAGGARVKVALALASGDFLLAKWSGSRVLNALAKTIGAQDLGCIELAARFVLAISASVGSALGAGFGVSNDIIELVVNQTGIDEVALGALERSIEVLGGQP